MPVVSFEFERSLTAELSVVRSEVTRTLEALGFKITASQITLLEAQRGSKLMGAALQGKKLPVRARIQFDPGENGCHLHATFTDNLYAPFRVYYGVNTPYQKLFGEAQQRIDATLARLDPTAAAGFDAAHFSSRAPTLGVLEKANTLLASGESAIETRAETMLEGHHDPATPEAWKDIDHVRFDGPSGMRILATGEVQAHMAVAMMVAEQPASLPENLRHELEQFAAKVERSLREESAGDSRIAVSATEVPILEFMHQQARIRESLPVRTLHICHDCHFERITNPDYERLMQRNRNLQALMGMVGVSASSSGISPFVLVGTIFRFKKLDPDYVCPRCQGMAAEEDIVTFCPECGDLRKDAVLRVCPKCKYDFLGTLPPEQFWQTAPPEPLVLPGPSRLLPEPSKPLALGQSRTCPSCQASIPMNAKFCPRCGAPVAETGTTGSICPTCQTPLAPGARFCTKCGTKVREPAPAAQPGQAADSATAPAG